MDCDPGLLQTWSAAGPGHPPEQGHLCPPGLLKNPPRAAKKGEKWRNLRSRFCARNLGPESVTTYRVGKRSGSRFLGPESGPFSERKIQFSAFFSQFLGVFFADFGVRRRSRRSRLRRRSRVSRLRRLRHFLTRLSPRGTGAISSSPERLGTRKSFTSTLTRPAAVCAEKRTRAQLPLVKIDLGRMHCKASTGHLCQLDERPLHLSRLSVTTQRSKESCRKSLSVVKRWCSRQCPMRSTRTQSGVSIVLDRRVHG